MPRRRKYDYQTDYPVTIFLKIPVGILNTLEDEMNIERDELSKIVERLLANYIENNKNTSRDS